jgi:DNA-binding transcriptional LysR family regulator
MDRLSAMEAFVRVIRTGSFSGAARQLRIGQPAVSKAIAQIEERLGVRLLLRTTHGLSPTESGQNYYEHAKRVIEEAEEADLAARGAAAALSGRLRFCAAVTFARLHVMPHLPAFLEQHRRWTSTSSDGHGWASDNRPNTPPCWLGNARPGDRDKACSRLARQTAFVADCHAE